MKLSLRLYLGFGLMIILLLSVVATEYFVITGLITKKDLLINVIEVDKSITETDSSTLDYYSTKSQESADGVDAGYNKTKTQLDKTLGMLSKSDEKTIVNDMSANLDIYYQSFMKYKGYVEQFGSHTQLMMDNIETIKDEMNEMMTNQQITFKTFLQNQKIMTIIGEVDVSALISEVEYEYDAVYLADRAVYLLLNAQIAQMNYMNNQKKTNDDDVYHNIKLARNICNDLIEKFGDGENVDVLNSALAWIDEYIVSYETCKELLVSMESEKGNLQSMSESITTSSNVLASAKEVEMEDEMKRAIMISLAFGLASMLISILLSMIITRSVVKQLTGNMNDLSISAGQVSDASIQLADASQQLSEGSTQQAASIEETSATMEETSSMVIQNAENTRQANLLSEDATKAAESGTGKMLDMAKSMEELKKSSTEISKIIKVIDDIAFQTNMLALNAAVEAARAGDAGLGFAVVAEEVRSLAQKSAEAAKNTAEIIEQNIGLSVKGVKMSDEVNISLGEIMSKTKDVNRLIAEISAASMEQSKGTAQVSEAIGQMEKVVQSNAATAEQSAASATALQNQAMALDNIVKELNALIKGRNKAQKLVAKTAETEEKAVMEKKVKKDKQVIKVKKEKKVKEKKDRKILSDLKNLLTFKKKEEEPENQEDATQHEKEQKEASKGNSQTKVISPDEIIPEVE